MILFSCIDADVTILSCLVTALVAWNIYTLVDFNRKVKDTAGKIFSESIKTYMEDVRSLTEGANLLNHARALFLDGYLLRPMDLLFNSIQTTLRVPDHTLRLFQIQACLNALESMFEASRRIEGAVIPEGRRDAYKAILRRTECPSVGIYEYLSTARDVNMSADTKFRSQIRLLALASDISAAPVMDADELHGRGKSKQPQDSSSPQ